MKVPAREQIERALASKQQARLDMVVIGLALDHVPDLEATLHEELAKQPHDVQEYWNGSCNCAGQHN